MKKTRLLSYCTLLAITLLATTGIQADNGGVASLRGDKAIKAKSVNPVMNKWQRDRDPIRRDHVQQPPLIPHKIKGYKINMKFNKCLTCHSWANYKQAGATKISQTHFSDRENNVLANISPRRYFCTQCHVPQTEARPLVGNTFKPLTLINNGSRN